MATEMRIGSELAEAHVGATNGGASDDSEERIDLSGGLHAAHGFSEEFGQHGERCGGVLEKSRCECECELSCCRKRCGIDLLMMVLRSGGRTRLIYAWTSMATSVSSVLSCMENETRLTSPAHATGATGQQRANCDHTEAVSASKHGPCLPIGRSNFGP